MRRLLVLILALPLLAQEAASEDAWTKAVNQMDAEMDAACGDDETMAAVARLLPTFDAVDGTAKTSRELRGKLQKYFAYSPYISPTVVRRMLASPDAGMQVIAVNAFFDHSDWMFDPENRRALLEAFDRPSTPDDTRVSIVGVFTSSPEIFAEIEARARVLTHSHGDPAHGAAIWMVAVAENDEPRLREYLAAPERALHEEALWMLVSDDFESSIAAVSALVDIARDQAESKWSAYAPSPPSAITMGRNRSAAPPFLCSPPTIASSKVRAASVATAWTSSSRASKTHPRFSWPCVP